MGNEITNVVPMKQADKTYRPVWQQKQSNEVSALTPEWQVNKTKTDAFVKQKPAAKSSHKATSLYEKMKEDVKNEPNWFKKVVLYLQYANEIHTQNEVDGYNKIQVQLAGL
jgi:hypothetical protein